MINCLLTVAQCPLITNHSAAENGIFQRNDLHQSSTIFLMEEKCIPKKLEKAKDNYGIPSGGNWGGARGARASERGELRSWQSCAGGAGAAAEPPGSLPCDSSEALLPRAGLWLQALCGKEEKRNPVQWHLTWLGVKQDKLRRFHFLYINLWFSQGTALH